MSEKLRKFTQSGIGISLIAGVILSIMAPYQTGQYPPLNRFFYWTILCFVGGLGAGAFLPLAGRLGKNPGIMATVIGQAFMATIAVTTCLLALDFYRTGQIFPMQILVMTGLVGLISIIIAGVATLSERAEKTDDPTPRRPALFERLKPALRQSEIYALMAEDHYVRVITSKGEDLILMRLADAVKEAEPLAGLSTHRSWWVAEAGIKTTSRSDGKISLELHTGQIVPVSRSNAKSVKEIGWI